ncbi:cytochrome b5-like [Andrographis paniculata]|uniref:cytochrome b5-like n=1 Tax=Andrographis paniculata TaxID=175694 RepID=UPI0021E84DE6|nr:cytochrome b5-like [Andrographis paniculata]
MAKVYTLEEVSKHNTKDDCWLVMFDKVYDVTKFLDDHPGGDEVLVTATGKDATDEFEDVGHSTTARTMLDEYYIGDIDSSTISKRPTPPPTATVQTVHASSGIADFLKFLVPLLILAAAIGVRYYTKQSSSEI